MRIFYVLLLTISFYTSSGQTDSQSSAIHEENIGVNKLSIYLPPNYDKTKSHKVLYFNDGQNSFSKQGLNLDGIASRLIESGLIEPIVIVGIHSGQNRMNNYIPYQDESVKADFGEYQPQATNYTLQLINKIIPFIEKNYVAKPDRGIAGFSFGGLHATWAALNYPETFSFSGSLSPSYWVADFKIFEEGSKAKSNQLYYFDIGTGEWNYYVPMLQRLNLPILKNAFYFEDENTRHILSDWRNRVGNILLLFAGKTDLDNYTIEIQTEVIKSQHSRKFYLRINPIIKYSNGLTCSISYAAKFEIQNPEDGLVNTDGSFVFKNPKDLIVKITYNGEEKEITIRYSSIEKIKSSL